MIIVAHGGAGEKRPEKKALKKLEEALEKGFHGLSAGGDALKAVIETIAVLEDSGLFNAGKGANLQLDGEPRLDASLMEGKFLQAGSVVGLEGFCNPIRAAEIVLASPHTIMTDKGAGALAKAHRLKTLARPDKRSMERLERLKRGGFELLKVYKKYFSTVGAVAMDENGDLAAGSSTGGVALMLPGRVGDTPIIGAGIYADNSLGAISCTGKGEDIIRLALAKEIAMNMKKKTPEQAARLCLNRLVKIGGQAGVIALNKKGFYCLLHTTGYMAGGAVTKKRTIVRESFERLE